jgi:hypothetical protein
MALMVGCSNNSPVANDSNNDMVFPYPGSSPDPMSTSLASVNTHMVAMPASELGDIPTAEETFLCRWTSGTWAATGTWDWRDHVFTFTIGSDQVLALETIQYLCGNSSDTYATAAAHYFPATETKALNYDLFGTVSWGLQPQLPSGWCWVLMVDWSWSGMPHGISYGAVLDWAGAMAHATTVPPINAIDGWPLSNYPLPYTVNLQ